MVSIKYHESVDPTWTEIAHERILTGSLVTVIVESNHGSRTLTVRGDCPRCPDDCDFALSLEAEVGLSAEEAGNILDELNVESASNIHFYTVRCNCSGHHEAPAGKRGCGTFFNVYAPSDEVANP
jgi:hypothetical protein